MTDMQVFFDHFDESSRGRRTIRSLSRRAKPMRERSCFASLSSMLAVLAWLVMSFQLEGCGKQSESQNGAGGAAIQPHYLGQEANNPHLYVETRTLMGTVFRLIVSLEQAKGPAEDLASVRKRAKRACQLAFDEVHRVESKMSDHLSGSDVVRINQAASKAFAAHASVSPTKVSKDTMLVLQEALQASRLTDGAFDVSYAALKPAWHMNAEGPHHVPTGAKIARALKFVGYRRIVLSPQDGTVRLAQHMRIDLGGIAKGYALDRASVALKQAGFQNFIVYGGGDLMVSGRRPKRPWRVGIQDPKHPQDYFAVLSVTNLAVVTSGDYERFFVKNGERYHHIINPKTGRPARGLRSVTVVADRAVYADAMATGLFVMGLDRAKRLVERIPDTEALFVTSSGNVVATSGLRSAVTYLGPYQPKKKFDHAAGIRARTGMRPQARTGNKAPLAKPPTAAPGQDDMGARPLLSPRTLRSARPAPAVTPHAKDMAARRPTAAARSSSGMAARRAPKTPHPARHQGRNQ